MKRSNNHLQIQPSFQIKKNPKKTLESEFGKKEREGSNMKKNMEMEEELKEMRHGRVLIVIMIGRNRLKN